MNRTSDQIWRWWPTPPRLLALAPPLVAAGRQRRSCACAIVTPSRTTWWLPTSPPRSATRPHPYVSSRTMRLNALLEHVDVVDVHGSVDRLVDARNQRAQQLRWNAHPPASNASMRPSSSRPRYLLARMGTGRRKSVRVAPSAARRAAARLRAVPIVARLVHRCAQPALVAHQRVRRAHRCGPTAGGRGRGGGPSRRRVAAESRPRDAEAPRGRSDPSP